MRILLKTFCCSAWNEVFVTPKKEKPEQHIDPYFVDLHTIQEMHRILNISNTFLKTVLHDAYIDHL